MGSSVLPPCRDAKGRKCWTQDTSRSHNQIPNWPSHSRRKGAPQKTPKIKKSFFMKCMLAVTRLVNHFKNTMNQLQVSTSSGLPCFHSSLNSTAGSIHSNVGERDMQAQTPAQSSQSQACSPQSGGPSPRASNCDKGVLPKTRM